MSGLFLYIVMKMLAIKIKFENRLYIYSDFLIIIIIFNIHNILFYLHEMLFNSYHLCLGGFLRILRLWLEYEVQPNLIIQQLKLTDHKYNLNKIP